jgi:hypothetical protein
MIGYALFALFYALTATMIFGVVAVYYTFGLPAMYGIIFIIFMVAIGMERKTGSAGFAEWFGSRGPVLPPPGKRALPPPGAAQIGHVQRKALPARKVELP